MISFNEYENVIYGIELVGSLNELWGDDYVNDMIPEPEIDDLMDVKPKHKWRIHSNAVQYKNIIKTDDILRILFKNAVYQVAYLGKVNNPAKELGKPEKGWKFYGIKKAIYHSHPSRDFYLGYNPKDPKHLDRISLVWWFKSGTIVFDFWKHSEYDEKLIKWQK